MSVTPSARFEAAQMLTYEEAADLLRVDKRTIGRRIKEGRYLTYGDGTGKRILYSSIVADIQRTTQQGGME